MKTKIFTALLLVLFITGCQKQPDQSASNPSTTDPMEKEQFEKSDTIIATYLDKLDSTKTSHEERIQILCKDYPTEYKTNYMPTLLKLSPAEYTEAKLLKDLDLALNYYKEKDNIHC